MIFHIFFNYIWILYFLKIVVKILKIFERIKNNIEIELFLNEFIKKVDSISFANRNQKICRIRVIRIDSIALTIKYFLFLPNYLFNYYFALFGRLVLFIFSLYSETLRNLILSSIVLRISLIFLITYIYYLI